MKKNKIKILAIGLVILIALVGCTPKTNDMTARNNKLSTQTRIGENNGWTRDDMNSGWNNNDMNMGMNNGMNNGLNDMLGDNANSIDPMNNDLNNGMTRSNNTNMSTSMGNMSKNASGIASKISALPEVNNAHVVLTNDTAVVGVNLRGTTQGTMTNALRQKIEKMVKDNSNITKVSVTSDPDIHKRIQTMSTGIGNGGMTNTITNDLNDIIRKIENVGNDILR